MQISQSVDFRIFLTVGKLIPQWSSLLIWISLKSLIWLQSENMVNDQIEACQKYFAFFFEGMYSSYICSIY